MPYQVAYTGMPNWETGKRRHTVGPYTLEQAEAVATYLRRDTQLKQITVEEVSDGAASLQRPPGTIE